MTKLRAVIDAGQRVATLRAFLGGYAGHGDSMSVTATFLSEAGKKLGVLKIGPVTATEQNRTTAMIEKAASKPVPKKTRSIQVKLAEEDRPLIQRRLRGQRQVDARSAVTASR